MMVVVFAQRLKVVEVIRAAPPAHDRIATATQQRICDHTVPACDAEEAALVDGIEVISAGHLHELASDLNGLSAFQIAQSKRITAETLPSVTVLTDFAEIKGQEVAKRALEVAAAGGHNLLMMCSITQSTFR